MKREYMLKYGFFLMLLTFYSISCGSEKIADKIQSTKSIALVFIGEQDKPIPAIFVTSDSSLLRDSLISNVFKLQFRFDIFVNIQQSQMEAFLEKIEIAQQPLEDTTDQYAFNLIYYEGLKTFKVIHISLSKEIADTLLTYVSNKQKQLSIENRFVGRLKNSARKN
jgi:hypothetical protein